MQLKNYNRQKWAIYIYTWYSASSQNIVAWLKFYISSMIKYSHIWLNLPRGDTHFLYIFHLDDRHFGFKTKLKKKKSWKKWRDRRRVWGLDLWHVTTLTKLYRESCLFLFLFFSPISTESKFCCCCWKLLLKLMASSVHKKQIHLKNKKTRIPP